MDKKIKCIEIQFPLAVLVSQEFYDKLNILLQPITDAHKEEWGQLEYYVKVLGDPTKKNTISEMEITFPTPVDLPSEVQRGMEDLLQPICDKHMQEHPDRVMWVFGQGSKPLWREPDEPEWDDEVYMIEIAERKAHPKELKAHEHLHVCVKCGGEVEVIPESQCTAILKCKKCGYQNVVLF
jgi:DNA-directed RNA polymerase subunit RPC12/RpoP